MGPVVCEPYLTLFLVPFQMYIIGLDPANSIFNVTYEARIEGVIMFGKEVGVIHGLFDKYN